MQMGVCGGVEGRMEVVVYRDAHYTHMTDGDILRAAGIQGLKREECKY